jgi:Mitochondrial ribosomal protein (VAR1)
MSARKIYNKKKMIKNKSNLSKNTKLLGSASGNSYKNIFNKKILWVKLYDNYLYLFLNKNTKNNKFNILEPKTKINACSAYAFGNGSNEGLEHPLATMPLATAISSSAALALPIASKTDNNKKHINKNTIKLLNLNNGAGGQPEGLQEVKKDIKIYKYINTISKHKNETEKYQNIVYLFNKNNKGLQNSSVGINKNVFTLLESTFLSMSSLISKPVIFITPNKVIIKLFYYLNKFYSNKKLLNINKDKLQFLCLNLSKIYKKPVELELDRLHYPYYDSNILSNMIGLISNIVKLRFIIKKLFKIAKIKKTKKYGNKYSIIPSYLSGFKIRVAGRLLTQRVIPRLTVKTIQRGTLARGKAKFVDSARFTNKNKRGSFSITITMGHIFL